MPRTHRPITLTLSSNRVLGHGVDWFCLIFFLRKISTVWLDIGKTKKDKWKSNFGILFVESHHICNCTLFKVSCILWFLLCLFFFLGLVVSKLGLP